MLEWVNNFLMSWLQKSTKAPGDQSASPSASSGVQQQINVLFKPPKVPGWNPQTDTRGPGLSNVQLKIPLVPRGERVRPRSGTSFFNYRQRGFQV